VQFVREATDAQVDETSNRRRRQHYGDDDELMAEQEERRRRQKLNKEFKTFAEKLKEASGDLVEADVPLRELGFMGVPTRSSVLMQPTTECLVQLSDPPFLVVSLSDIEIAYLERVQFNIKNFDLVLVFKDFKKVPIHINSIPMAQVEAIKDWLDSVDICYLEGPINLNWNNIMKSVNEDPKGFFEDGGWAQFYEDSDQEQEVDEEESASEYEGSESSESEEESSEYSEDGDASEEDDISTEAEDDESGEDWDELEAKARRDDEKRRAMEKGGVVASKSKSQSKRRDDDSDDDTRPKKKKR
jgi:nucleosome binding factor SPN SPT16 subunit